MANPGPRRGRWVDIKYTCLEISEIIDLFNVRCYTDKLIL